ncbi:MAG: hypothetical protein WDA75_02195 [Candidatus Latescibacterota bacterium]|jgi:hypothetical protein
MAKRSAASPKGGPAAATEAAAVAPSLRIWDRPWFPVAVLALLSLAYFSEFVLTDKVVYGYDVALDLHHGEDLSFGEKLKTLSQPMWNPQLGGYPQSEEIRFQYFPAYPIYLFTSYHHYLGWRYLLTMFAAGWGAYLLLRELQAGRWPALWAGVAYMSAPTFLSFPYAGHYAKMGVIALFPLMLFLLERLLRRHRLGYAAGLGVAIAACAYSPHPQMLYYALLGLGLWFLFRVVPTLRVERRAAARQAGLFSLAVVLGVGLGAEGLFPSYLYTKGESKRAGGEEGRTPAEQLAFAQSWSLHPEEVGSLIVPEFGGFDDLAGQEYRYWGRNGMKTNSEYFGVLVLLLALVAVADARRQPLVLFMGIWFLVALAFTLGGHTPVHKLAFYLLPGAKVLRTVGMAAYLFALAACVLAALGLSRLLAADPGERAVLSKRVLVAGGVLTGLALLVAVAPRGVTEAWISLFYSDIPADRRQILAAGYSWLARGGLIVALVAGAGIALLYLRLQAKVSTGALIAGLCLLTLVDTWRIDRVFLRYEDPATHVARGRENPRTVQFLKQSGDLFRVFPLPDHTILDRPGFHLDGAVSVTGRHDFTMRRYDRLLKEFDLVTGWLGAKYYQGEEIPYADEDLLARVHPLLNLVNARYLVAPGPVQLRSELFPEAHVGERYRVYANPRAMPWFYLVPGWETVPGEDQALARLRAGEVDLAKTAILEQEPRPAFASDPVAPVDNDRVEKLEYDLPTGRITVRTTSPGPRLLVISENFHPNWQVRVDGQDGQLLRANYLWQAVSLSPGEHRVELRYASPVVSRSRWAGLLSLALVAALLAWEIRQRRGRTSGPAVPVAPVGGPAGG